jgi:hypothetical protein
LSAVTVVVVFTGVPKLAVHVWAPDDPALHKVWVRTVVPPLVQLIKNVPAGSAVIATCTDCVAVAAASKTADVPTLTPVVIAPPPVVQLVEEVNCCQLTVIVPAFVLTLKFPSLNVV